MQFPEGLENTPFPSNTLADFNNINKEFFQKILKKYPKNSLKNPKNFQTISPKFLILKKSNSLYRTWRPKPLLGLFYRTLQSMPRNDIQKGLACKIIILSQNI